MEKGILHLHITIVIILLLFTTFKTILLLIDKIDLLDKIREKTKVVDMILGPLVIATGVYLMITTRTTDAYIWGKILAVLMAIPLGIIGMKRKLKSLAVVSVFLLFYAYGVAETNSLRFKRDKFELPADDQDLRSGDLEVDNLGRARSLYQNLCMRCHGMDGKAMIAGATDLSVSEKSIGENEKIIANGKGLMPGFRHELSEQDVNLLAEYVLNLREKQ